MPALIHDWTHALMSILLKYQEVTPLGELGGMLVRLSKGLRGLRDLLADPQRTVFIGVSRAAALPRLETVRLLERLAALGIPVPAVIANAVGRGTCARCRRMGAAETRELAALGRALERRVPRRLVIAPGVVPAPRGAAAVASWSRSWREAPARGTRTRAISSTR
jgi:anion-transporting  ArsA/GET3 family ATPase